MAENHQRQIATIAREGQRGVDPGTLRPELAAVCASREIEHLDTRVGLEVGPVVRRFRVRCRPRRTAELNKGRLLCLLVLIGGVSHNRVPDQNTRWF